MNKKEKKEREIKNTFKVHRHVFASIHGCTIRARKLQESRRIKNFLVSDIRDFGSEFVTRRELFCPGYFRGYFRETFGSNGKR